MLKTSGHSRLGRPTSESSEDALHSGRVRPSVRLSTEFWRTFPPNTPPRLSAAVCEENEENVIATNKKKKEINKKK